MDDVVVEKKCGEEPPVLDDSPPPRRLERAEPMQSVPVLPMLMGDLEQKCGDIREDKKHHGVGFPPVLRLIWFRRAAFHAAARPGSVSKRTEPFDLMTELVARVKYSERRGELPRRSITDGASVRFATRRKPTAGRKSRASHAPPAMNPASPRTKNQETSATKRTISAATRHPR